MVLIQEINYSCINCQPPFQYARKKHTMIAQKSSTNCPMLLLYKVYKLVMPYHFVLYITDTTEWASVMGFTVNLVDQT